MFLWAWDEPMKGPSAYSAHRATSCDELAVWRECAGRRHPQRSVPSFLRHFSGVNLKNNAPCDKSLFPALRYAKPAIDFHLANLVLPKEVREFPLKLPAFGWDLGKQTGQPRQVSARPMSCLL